MQVWRWRTSPGTVGGGDRRSALHSGDEGRLKIKQVTVQIGHTEERERVEKRETGGKRDNERGKRSKVRARGKEKNVGEKEKKG